MKFKITIYTIMILCVSISVWLFMGEPEFFMGNEHNKEKLLTIDAKGAVLAKDHVTMKIKGKENDRMKYSFYSHIHRFMRFKLAEFEAFAAKIDFTDSDERKRVNTQFQEMIELLNNHASHEDKVYHEMLKKKGSKILEKYTNQHHLQDKQLAEMQKLLHTILQSENSDQQKKLGYEFYLSYTDFQSDYLKHLLTEEIELMSELHRLYGERALREITFSTYKSMTQDQMNGMFSVLFPYVNAAEREIFLTDVRDGAPEKFEASWKFAKTILEPREKKQLAKKLDLKTQIQ